VELFANICSVAIQELGLGMNNDTALDGLGFNNLSVQVWFQNCTCLNNNAEEATSCSGKQLLKQVTFDNNGFGIWRFQRDNMNSGPTTSANEDNVEHCLGYRQANSSSQAGILYVQAV